MIAENILSRLLVAKLEPYFEIFPEMWSVCRKYRIDFIVEDKRCGATFGIEVKKVDHKRGNDLGEHILQAVKYSQAEFGDWGKLPIFICPPLSYDYLVCPDHETMQIINGHEYFKDRHDKNHEHHTVNGLLCPFNIGELRTQMKYCWAEKRNKQYLKIMFCNKEIWSNLPVWDKPDEYKGLHRANYEHLMRKVNG